MFPPPGVAVSHAESEDTVKGRPETDDDKEIVCEGGIEPPAAAVKLSDPGVLWKDGLSESEYAQIPPLVPTTSSDPSGVIAIGPAIV